MNNDGRSDVVFAGQSSDGTTTLGTWLSNGSGFGGAVFTGTLPFPAAGTDAHDRAAQPAVEAVASSE